MIGVAMGLVLAASSQAAPTPPTFVGDAGNQGPDAISRLNNSSNYRRWGDSAHSQKGDEAPLVLLKQNPSGLNSLPHVGDPGQPTPADVRNQLQAYLQALGPNSPEYKRIMARLALIPGNQANFGGDVHPIQFVEWLKSLPDNQQNILPKPNTIQIVDQDALQHLFDTKQPLPQPVYRTVTTTIITHHLVPTYATVQTQFPV